MDDIPGCMGGHTTLFSELTRTPRGAERPTRGGSRSLIANTLSHNIPSSHPARVPPTHTKKRASETACISHHLIRPHLRHRASRTFSLPDFRVQRTHSRRGPSTPPFARRSFEKSARQNTSAPGRQARPDR
ncbi:hypothetical protein PUNSTDRAFT_52915 [Punctularia strigosozonata HHB-11173 SS5]|uniref:uncharacterized protein n=1 Tax=Punctularia strigosozonata (strain HHB-11173) TaxID=741275 RepID=UPI0004416C85|nr:uncharacterized protein PUNSTDRAFT_52915 [Punctularia strigosozonata HHB-11173 SS5]EIN08540.1 hypothetical protein PUNSTDRAFT_52915 [Punctularia strigosozonata HHB-11173 SS5]